MKDRRAILLVSIAALTALLVVSGCQPQANENPKPAADASNAAVDVAWSADSDCTTCHSSEGSSFSDAKVPASKHDGTCITCHSDEAMLADVHEDSAGKEPPKKLKSTEIDDAACLSCHGSYEELAAATAGSTLLTDDKGTTVNPHEAPGLTESHSPMTCGNCHSLHSDESAQTMAPEFCASCHHEGVYECGTCHS